MESHHGHTRYNVEPLLPPEDHIHDKRTLRHRLRRCSSRIHEDVCIPRILTLLFFFINISRTETVTDRLSFLFAINF
jgi:hypothetical protein